MFVNSSGPSMAAFNVDAGLMQARMNEPAPKLDMPANGKIEEQRQKFQEFVAGTFFQQMLKAMRETVPEGEFMHGGRAEEMFRNQLDATLAKEFATERGGPFADEMFERFISGQQNASAEGAPGLTTKEQPLNDIAFAGIDFGRLAG